MHFVSIISSVLAFSAAGYAQNYYTVTSTNAVAAARATTMTLSPVSSIKGNRFDRFVNICELI
jgi:hypothetical protein